MRSRQMVDYMYGVEGQDCACGDLESDFIGWSRRLGLGSVLIFGARGHFPEPVPGIRRHPGPNIYGLAISGVVS
jgi:hypothetical protein